MKNGTRSGFESRGLPLSLVIPVPEKLGSVQGEIRLTLDLVHSAEDDPARLVLYLHELVPLHGLRDGTAEGCRANIAVDQASSPLKTRAISRDTASFSAALIRG